MKLTNRYLYWGAGGVVLIAAVVATYLLLINNYAVPAEFSEARINGASIAEEIIAQQKYTLEVLSEIERLDKAGDRAQALILISEAVIRNREANTKAGHLSSQLQQMAMTSATIKPAMAQTLALQAVTSEVALVSRLLNYNNYLAQLFDALKDKFEYRRYVAASTIQELIRNVNDEVRAINGLNQEFTSLLENFDQLVLEN